MATDLDLQIVESVSAQVEQPGATTISAHTLFDIARKLPEGSQVSLHAAEGKMLIQAGRARFNLSTLPRADFPAIAEGDQNGRATGRARVGQDVWIAVVGVALKKKQT